MSIDLNWIPNHLQLTVVVMLSKNAPRNLQLRMWSVVSSKSGHRCVFDRKVGSDIILTLDCHLLVEFWGDKCFNSLVSVGRDGRSLIEAYNTVFVLSNILHSNSDG